MWWPHYSDGDGFTIDSLSSNECPVSCITPESRQLVRIFSRADFVHQASGAAPFGSDLSTWPARMVDACTVIQQERNRTDNARFEAERNT